MQLTRSFWWHDFVLGLISLGMVGCAASPQKSAATTKTEKRGSATYTEQRFETDIFSATYDDEPTTIKIARARAQIRVCEMCLAAGYPYMRETENAPPYEVIPMKFPDPGDPSRGGIREHPHQTITYTARGYKTGGGMDYLDCAFLMDYLRPTAALPPVKKN